MLVSSSVTFMHVVCVSPSQNKVLICPYPKQCKHLLATACLCLSAWTRFALSCQLHYQPPWATLQLTASQLIQHPHLQLCCSEKAERDSTPSFWVSTITVQISWCKNSSLFLMATSMHLWQQACVLVTRFHITEYWDAGIIGTKCREDMIGSTGASWE